MILTANRMDQAQIQAGVADGEGPGTVPLWLSNSFGESDEEGFEGFKPDWMTDSGRYLMKMDHNFSSNCQMGMIPVTTCSYCICVQQLCLMLLCIHTRHSHIDVLKFVDMFCK